MSENRILAWVNMLASLTAARPEDAPSGEAIATFSRLLDDVPEQAFTEASLRVVAAEFSWWPSYAQLRSAIIRWWSANKPTELSATLRFTGPREDENFDRAIKFYWTRHVEITADGYRPKHGSIAADLAHLQSWTKKDSLLAWARVTGVDEARPGSC